MFAAMDAATPPDLDQLDSKALKSLILALHEQAFSHRKQLTTQQEEILSQREPRFARCRNRALEAAHRKATPHGIRSVVGEEGKSDRTTGTAAGRARGEAQKRKNCNSRINGKHYRGAPCAAALTRSLTKGSAKVSSEARSLSGLWREAKASWSGYFGGPGVRASQSQSHPIRSSQAGLCRLRSDRAGGSPEPANRARDGGSWAFGACADLEILRPPTAVSSVADLCAFRCGVGSFHPGRVGRWIE
jgi:hypothetical protein